MQTKNVLGHNWAQKKLYIYLLTRKKIHIGPWSVKKKVKCFFFNWSENCWLTTRKLAWVQWEDINSSHDIPYLLIISRWLHIFFRVRFRLSKGDHQPKEFTSSGRRRQSREEQHNAASHLGEDSIVINSLIESFCSCGVPRFLHLLQLILITTRAVDFIFKSSTINLATSRWKTNHLVLAILMEPQQPLL